VDPCRSRFGPASIMPSPQNLALAATLLALFAVNAEAAASRNMCMDPAQMTGTCTQVNKEIEDKLPVSGFTTGSKYDILICAELCGPAGAAALQLMHANPSCCGGSKAGLACHSSDGTCDPSASATASTAGDGDALPIILVMMSLIILVMACVVICGRAKRKAPKSPEGAGDHVGSLHWKGTVPCFCIPCADGTERALPPYSITPAEEWCYSMDPKGKVCPHNAACPMPRWVVFSHAISLSLSRFLGASPSLCR